MKSIKISQLENGIRIVTERQSQFESAAIGIWIKCGLDKEPDKRVGISHYLEHMLFKGTKRRTARQISAEIDNLGGHLNGYTERENTCYFVHLLGDYQDTGADVLLDMVFDSLLGRDAVETEREVIVQEIRRLEDNPEEYIHDMAVNAAWKGHPLGRSIHGSVESVEAMSREHLMRYFRRHYRPDNILVAAAGRVDHDRLVAFVEKATADRKRGNAARQDGAPQFRSGRRDIVRDLEQAHICVALPGASQLDDSRYSQALVDTVLGGATSSRLFQEVREKRGLVYSIGSYSLSYRDGGLFLVSAGTDARNTDEVLELILKEISAIRENGLTDKELTWAKAYARGTLALARESTSYRMQRLARAMLYEGRVVSHREYLRRFERVKPAHVHAFTERFLSSEPVIMVMGPKG